MKKGNIALIGFMAAGKTKVSKELSKLCPKRLISTDALIEKKEGRSIKEIFQDSGEAYFRQLEKEVVKEIAKENDIVIDCGGGIVLDPDNMRHLKENCTVIYLSASPDVLYQRVKNRIKHRPLLNVDDPLLRIKGLMKKRKTLYEQADIVVNTEKKTVDEVCREILGLIKS